MRKKEGNKEEKIFNAALKSFATHGFYRSRVEEIARNAGISVGSIYVYYKDKKDILYRIFERTWTELYKNLLFIYDRTDLKATDKVDLIIELVFDTFSKNPDLAVIITNEQRKLYADHSKKFTPYYDKFLDLAKKIIQQGTEEGTFYENIHWEVMRYFVIGSFRELLSTWVTHKSNLSLDNMKESVKFLIKYGISKYPPGEKLISETPYNR